MAAYRYREGVHGEHCIDVGELGFVRSGTVGRAATKEDAVSIIQALEKSAALNENLKHVVNLPGAVRWVERKGGDFSDDVNNKAL